MKGKWWAFLVAFLMVLMTAGAAAAADKPVRIGFVYIMSGPAAVYGQFAKQGAELAIDEVNQAGGIAGRKVEGLFEDDAGKPDMGIRAVRKLVYENEVDVVRIGVSRKFW